MAFSKKVFTKKALGLLAGISVLASLAGCITFPHNGVREVMPLGQSTFSEYVAQTTDWINTHRRFVTNDRLTELSHQVPFEIRPAVPNGKGILIISGVGTYGNQYFIIQDETVCIRGDSIIAGYIDTIDIIRITP